MTVAMAPTLLRYSIGLAILTIGVALVVCGAITWHYEDFAVQGVWLHDNGWKPHPTHLLVIGTCMIPLALWDIFLLEQRCIALRRATLPVPAEEGVGTAVDAAVAGEVESA